MKELFEQTANKGKQSNFFASILPACKMQWYLFAFMPWYHHALKSTKTTSQAVQRLPNHLRHSFYKYIQIHVDFNKSLSLLQFEKWVEITVYQYFNPIASIVSSQESNKFTQRTSQEFTRITIYNYTVQIAVQLSVGYVQKHINYHLAQCSSQNH